MPIKRIIKKIFYFPFLPNQKVEKNQEIVRKIEWEAIVDNIPVDSKFLDVGCGAGQTMKMAKTEKNCTVTGIDPQPGKHGVGRYQKDFFNGLNILKANSELLPFGSNSFDVVFCSHVLEHVDDEKKSLWEIYRVLKVDGVLIIGMPTATMAFINLISSWLFLTHIQITRFFLELIRFEKPSSFIHIFIPKSHSFPRAKYIFSDLKHYRVRNWEKTVRSVFIIKKKLLPALYPYPEYLPLFKIRKNCRFSSSVFFICQKK